MLGELSVAIADLTKKLQTLQDESVLFRLANDGVMNPFLFEKKMAVLEERVIACKNELEALKREYKELVDYEVKEEEENPGPDPFLETFNDLSNVEGVDNRKLYN